MCLWRKRPSILLAHPTSQAALCGSGSDLHGDSSSKLGSSAESSSSHQLEEPWVPPIVADGIEDSPDWLEGDFALVSSDGWRFYTRQVVLAWASPVLSDAIDVCSVTPAGAPFPKPEIHFADLVVETSAVIAIFLELVAKGQFAMWTNDFASCHAMCRAIAFMRKYECEVPLSILRLWAVNELLLRKIAPLYVFMVAAAMDDVELSIMVFENRYVPVLGQDSVTSHGVPGIQDMKLLEAVLSLTPRGGEDAVWPFGLWTRFPAEYLWAVSKAWSKGCSKSSSGDRLYTLSQMTAMSSSAVGRRTLSSASTARTMSRPRSYESANFSDTDDPDCDFDMAREYRVAIRAVKALST